MNKIKELINKHKEFINYGFWGVITTLLHIALFWLLTKIGIKYYISNLITLVTIKSLAYIVNKFFVFKTKCKNKKELLNEIIKYILSRLFTMIIDYFGLILLVEVFKINELIGKIIVLIVVVIINYFLCKKIVYKNEDDSMKKIKEFLKKYWFVLSIILLCVLRFLFTYKLPSFYLFRMSHDDDLYVKFLYSLLRGDYLGSYDVRTIIKGPVFAFILFVSKLYKMSFSSFFTIIYIISCLFFLSSLKNIIKEKKYLIIVFLVLLFNPVTFSSDLFQRLYRSSISITELLFFLGSVIRVLFSKDIKARNYMLLGISLSFMFLTREDNIWTYPVLLFIIFYHIFKYKKIKLVILSLTPIMILITSKNIISIVNYKHYGIYTYNEIQESEFHNTYKKILQIKDDEKIHMVSIPKSTIYRLADNTKTFNFSKEEIDRFYHLYEYYEYESTKGEIYNGNIVWNLRSMISLKNGLKSGKKSEDYYKKLGEEIDKLFENGTFEKEFIMPSTYMAVPMKEDFINLPKKVLETIIYTTTYKNIKTLTKTDEYLYNKDINAYYFEYIDYHDTANIVKKNPVQYEIIRKIYEFLTIVFSFISLFIYFKNIKKFDSISILSHLLLICYLLIIGGVSYTHISSFNSIRPLYLANIYIIQSIFIIINVHRIKDIKRIYV